MRIIKFTACGARWFDRTNGNTYHSVQIHNLETGETISQGETYGYDDHYKQTALTLMLKAGWLPEKYTEKDVCSFERENDYPIIWHVSDGLKRDMKANADI